MTIDMNRKYTTEEIKELDLPIGTVLVDEAGDPWSSGPDGRFRFDAGPVVVKMASFEPYTICNIPSEHPPFPEPDWRTEGWTPTWIPVWVRGEELPNEVTMLHMRRYGGADLQSTYLDEWSTRFGTAPPISEKPKWNEDEAGVSLEEAKRIAKLLSEFEEQED